MLLSSVYLSTFLDKTSLAFLSGEKLQAIFASHYTGSDYLDAWWWTLATQGTAIVVWLLEGLLIFGLFVPRLRPWLIVSGIALHLTFYMAFRVYAFSTNMILLYLAFVPPETVKRITDVLTGFDAPRPSEHAVTSDVEHPTRGAVVFQGAVLVSLLGGALTVAVLQLSAVPLDQRVPRFSTLPSKPLEATDDETPAPPHKTREMQRWSPRY